MDKAIEQIMAAITVKIIHHEDQSKNQNMSEQFRSESVFVSMGLREALECCYGVQRQLRTENNSGSQDHEAR